MTRAVSLLLSLIVVVVVLTSLAPSSRAIAQPATQPLHALAWQAIPYSARVRGSYRRRVAS